jgi:1-deoxy-D-xylulose-5-phosphate synthase
MLDKIDTPEDLRALPAHKMPAVAQALRNEIIEVCAKNGGHLGASLGTVELCIALHRVFHTPEDSLVFDVGHQAYCHKLLTGRRELFQDLRQEGGASGFLNRAESAHDSFGAGHASTSISAALGLLEGKRILSEEGRAVAIIGDGAMTGGLAFEALFNGGHLDSGLIVVLNDNDMSIAPNVGAMSSWLSRKLTIGDTYLGVKESIKGVLANIPQGDRIKSLLKHTMESTKAMLTPGILFEGLGFAYIGPVDGHDIVAMEEVFERVRQLDEPVLVHVMTTKGKGYGAAERDRLRMHGVGAFKRDDHGNPINVPSKAGPPKYQDAFAKALISEAERDPRVVAITAAMPDGTSLGKFAKVFPERFYDVGIAEGHGVTFAAGLAAAGARPVCGIYSTFLQRALDSIIHDVALQQLPVVFAMDRAGLVGADGATHQGVFDIPYLRMIPGMVCMAPSDENELSGALATALSCEGPSAFRFPRGVGTGVAIDPNPEPWKLGKARWLRADKGAELSILALGPQVQQALIAAEELAARGLRSNVLDMRFVKPIDAEAISSLAEQPSMRFITLEEGVLAGGFGAAVIELLSDRGLSNPLRRIGIPDRFIEHGSVTKQYAEFGLDAPGIIAAALELCPGDHKTLPNSEVSH